MLGEQQIRAGILVPTYSTLVKYKQRHSERQSPGRVENLRYSKVNICHTFNRASRVDPQGVHNLTSLERTVCRDRHVTSKICCARELWKKKMQKTPRAHRFKHLHLRRQIYGCSWKRIYVKSEKHGLALSRMRPFVKTIMKINLFARENSGKTSFLTTVTRYTSIHNPHNQETTYN